MLKVGFIGLGTMGYPIAGHISKSYETLVFNRTINKSQKWSSQFKGEVCESIEDLTSKSNIIFFIDFFLTPYTVSYTHLTLPTKA